MMANATTRPFDVADHLDNPEEVAAYLDAVLEEGDDKLLLVALRNVVKSRGFANVAQGAGLRRLLNGEAKLQAAAKAAASCRRGRKPMVQGCPSA